MPLTNENGFVYCYSLAFDVKLLYSRSQRQHKKMRKETRNHLCGMCKQMVLTIAKKRTKNIP